MVVKRLIPYVGSAHLYNQITEVTAANPRYDVMLTHIDQHVPEHDSHLYRICSPIDNVSKVLVVISSHNAY